MFGFMNITKKKKSEERYLRQSLKSSEVIYYALLI